MSNYEIKFKKTLSEIKNQLEYTCPDAKSLYEMDVEAIKKMFGLELAKSLGQDIIECADALTESNELGFALIAKEDSEKELYAFKEKIKAYKNNQFDKIGAELFCDAKSQIENEHLGALTGLSGADLVAYEFGFKNLQDAYR